MVLRHLGPTAPIGTRLRLGESAVVEVTGLRNPCAQLNGIQSGVMAAAIDCAEHGDLVREAGIMSIVITDGAILVGDLIAVELPSSPRSRLIPV